MATDAWISSGYGFSGGNTEVLLLDPTDAPAVYGVDITVRSDGDVIVTYHGENPSTMGGTYQEIAYSRWEGSSWTNGVVVASTGGKNDNRLYPSISMGSSDQAMVIYHDDTTGDLLLRALSSANALRTERTIYAFGSGTIAQSSYHQKPVYFTQSSLNRHGFLTRTSDSPTPQIRWTFFSHFTDDTDPAKSTVQLDTDVHIAGLTYEGAAVDDLANDEVYFGRVENTSADLFLSSDDGTSGTFSDDNSGNAIRTGTIDGLSANLYTRSSTKYYAFVYDDAGTIKYDEWSLGGGPISRTTTFAGSGSLATSAALKIPATTAFSATGSMATTATLLVTLPRTTAFDAVGSLSTQAALAAATVFAGAGALAASAKLKGTTAFNGAGALATSATLTIPETTAFAGSGGMATQAVLAADTLFSGAGGVVSSALLKIAETTTFVGAGGLATQAVLAATTTFTASGSMATTATLSGGTLSRTTAFDAAGTLTSAASLKAATAFAGAGTMSAAAKLKATTAFSGAGGLATAGALTIPATTAMVGAGSMVATSLFRAATTLGGTGSMVSAAALAAVTNFAGLGSLSTAALFRADTAFNASGSMVTVATLSGGTLSRSTLFSAAGGMSTTAQLTIPATTAFAASAALITAPKFRAATLFAGSGSLVSAGRFRATSLFEGQGEFITVGKFRGATLFSAQGDLVTVGAIVGGKVVQCTLVSRSGAPLPNLVNLSWAWFDNVDPTNFAAPTDQGQIESTDGAALIDVSIPNSTLIQGQSGTLVLRSDDGTSLGAYNLALI
jgi:hypothetical protein